MDNITFAHVIRAASELVSDEGENEEYDRAIVELTCDLLSISTESRDAVLPFLRALRPH
jgi:hypothetical protein